jgi:hypothetical protein
MKTLARIGMVALSTLVTLVVGEGARSLLMGGRPHVSLSSDIVTRRPARLGRRAPAPSSAAPLPADGSDAVQREGALYLSDRRELEALVPALKSIDAGVGNTDVADLVSENASINIEAGDCTRMKANLRKLTTQIRSDIFDVYDPPVVFYDADRALPDSVRAFLDRYGVRSVTLTTNAYGERTTLPLVDRDEKTLVAGDSVALGVGLTDAETLASRLQEADASRQYVNLGIAGVSSPQIECALDAAARRYAGAIAELIYVFCDNDYDPEDPRTAPSSVIAWLQHYATAHGIGRVTVVRSPFIRVVFPHREALEKDRFRAASARQLAQLAAAARFRYLDIAMLAASEGASRATIFGPLQLFIDRVHLSPDGSRLVAQSLARTS